jgi:hypothetical protein
MASFTVVNRRTGHSRRQPANVRRVDERLAHAMPENNLEPESVLQGGADGGGPSRASYPMAIVLLGNVS